MPGTSSGSARLPDVSALATDGLARLIMRNALFMLHAINYMYMYLLFIILVFQFIYIENNASALVTSRNMYHSFCSFYPPLHIQFGGGAGASGAGSCSRSTVHRNSSNSGRKNRMAVLLSLLVVKIKATSKHPLPFDKMLQTCQ